MTIESGIGMRELMADSARLLEDLRTRQLKLVTAESCTGGLIAAIITEHAGASDVFDRGFVTYSDEAKTDQLGVGAAMLSHHGAVSREVALAMAAGALRHSLADLAVAVTGIAGPGGGSAEKPVGLVHIAAARRDHDPMEEELRLGDIGRREIRLATVGAALNLLRRLL